MTGRTFSRHLESEPEQLSEFSVFACQFILLMDDYDFCQINLYVFTKLHIYLINYSVLKDEFKILTGRTFFTEQNGEKINSVLVFDVKLFF